MTQEQLLELVRAGEGLTTEFKECRSALNRDVYESVCAFLNRHGGVVLLGVRNDGEVTGIEPAHVERIKQDLVTALNNPQKLNPPLYVAPERLEVDGRTVLALTIPESSQVHRCNGRVFDRNEDGDLDVTAHSDAVANLYLRKQAAYTETRIYPYVTRDDLRPDLLVRVRKLARGERPEHPWLELDDGELLKSARLYQRDYQTGKEGFTLAAVLLLGRDEVIQSILPHYRTDALLRVQQTDRYDDRDDIRTNLIESYDRLMAFVAKHLPDRFHLIGDQRTSLRDRIFREVIANLLIHREYLNAFPAKLIIEADRVWCENANRPHGYGLIDPATFSPFPKNPIIASFFREIGRADELGSGVKNLYRYCRVYADGAEPQLIEGDVFKTIIPLSATVTAQVTGQATDQATEPVNGSSDTVKTGNETINVGSETVDSVSEAEAQEIREALQRRISDLVATLGFTRSDITARVEALLLAVHKEPGRRAPEYAERIGAGLSTTKKYLAHLADADLVRFTGATKTGGYYLTDTAIRAIHHE